MSTTQKTNDDIKEVKLPWKSRIDRLATVVFESSLAILVWELVKRLWHWTTQ